MQMQFTMPFDWNITRLEKQNQVLVHQEVSVPKQSELATKSYLGTVNGIDVTRNLMIDGSNSTKNVIHFMLPKPVVLQIAEQVNSSGQNTNISNNNNNGTQTTSNATDSLMRFTLAPSGTNMS